MKHKVHVHHERCPPAWSRSDIFDTKYFTGVDEILSWLAALFGKAWLLKNVKFTHVAES